MGTTLVVVVAATLAVVLFMVLATPRPLVVTAVVELVLKTLMLTGAVRFWQIRSDELVLLTLTN